MNRNFFEHVAQKIIPKKNNVCTRANKDGAHGSWVVEENNELLKVAYLTLKFEQKLVLTGGNKKGFINAKNRLTKDAMDALKSAWNKFYSNNEESVILLNDGLTFQEASNTSVEKQLNENKNSINNSILEIFGCLLIGIGKPS